MAKLADALGLGPSGVTPVEVQVLSPAPFITNCNHMPPHESFHSQFERQYKDRIGLSHTEAEFFRAYNLLEMELIVARAELEDKLAQGYVHYKDIVLPVPTVNRASFHPSGTPDAFPRRKMMRDSLFEVDVLLDLYGLPSIWIGPPKNEPTHSLWLEAERRAIWFNERYKLR